MLDKEAVKDFFVEDDEITLLGKQHFCFLSLKDIEEFGKLEYDQLIEMIENLHIVNVVSEYQNKFVFGEVPKKNKKKYEEYEYSKLLENKIECYLDFIELSPEEKLMIKFLSEKNTFTLDDARKGIPNFYERAISIYPSEVLFYLFNEDADFCERINVKTSTGFADASIRNDDLYLSPIMVSKLLGYWDKENVYAVGKDKLLNAFIDAFENSKIEENDILKYKKQSLTNVVGACFNILANAENLQLSKEQINLIERINLDALRNVMVEHLNNKPGRFYVITREMSDVKWNQDDNNVIYSVFNEPYVNYSKLSDENKKRFAENYVEILKLAQSKNTLSSVDAVENIMAQNEYLKKVDSSFCDNVSSFFVENLKKIDIEKDIIQDIQGENAINMRKALKSFISTTKNKEEILACMSAEQIKKIRNFNTQNSKNVDEISKINE